MDQFKDTVFRWYEDMAKTIKDQLGDRYVEDLTSADIQIYLNTLKYKDNGQPSSESRIKKISEILNSILKYSFEESYIPRSPYNSNVERPKGVELDSRETAFTVEETVKLLKTIKHCESPVMRSMIPALLVSGLRIGEMLCLKYSDLDRDVGTISVKNSLETTYDEDTGKAVRQLGTTKTVAGKRVIPVLPVFFGIIDNWKAFVEKDDRRVDGAKKQGNYDIIFINNDGKLRNVTTTRSKCTAILIKAGLKKSNTTFHGFRRTYATFMYEAGVSDTTIAKLLGHEVKSDDGADVARSHYINKARTAHLDTSMSEAVRMFDEYVGKFFLENIHFTHLKKSQIRSKKA